MIAALEPTDITIYGLGILSVVSIALIVAFAISTRERPTPRHAAGSAPGTVTQRQADAAITGEFRVIPEETGPVARGRVFQPAPPPVHVAYFSDERMEIES